MYYGVVSFWVFLRSWFELLLIFVQAQEDADKLRSVITPFEEEISSLKAELRHCHEHMAVLEGKVVNSMFLIEHLL